MIDPSKILFFMFTYLASTSSLAETVYVTDQFHVGIHFEKTLNSPIITIVSSGTSLELIKVEDQLSFVLGPSGTEGWIDSSYISTSSSANVLLRNAEAQIMSLESSLAELQQNLAANNADNSSSEDDINLMQQQLQEERLRTTELQTEIDNLNKQIESTGNPDSLYEKIEQLSVANTQLEGQLARIISNTPPDQLQALGVDTSSSWNSTKNIFILGVVLLLIGSFIGVYLMDYLGRKRHGGFRV